MERCRLPRSGRGRPPRSFNLLYLCETYEAVLDAAKRVGDAITAASAADRASDRDLTLRTRVRGFQQHTRAFANVIGPLLTDVRADGVRPVPLSHRSALAERCLYRRSPPTYRDVRTPHQAAVEFIRVRYGTARRSTTEKYVQRGRRAMYGSRHEL